MWGQGWEEALSTSAPRVDSPQHSAAALPVPHPASASAREAAEWEAALAGRQPPGRTIVAAIECGSHSTRLLVTDGVTDLDRLTLDTCLGADPLLAGPGASGQPEAPAAATAPAATGGSSGTSGSGASSGGTCSGNDKRGAEAAGGETLEALRAFAARLRGRGAACARAVATAALRAAAPAAAGRFLSEAEGVLGHPVEVISGEEEGALAFAGAASSLEPGEPCLVVDLGGRSTEFCYGVARGAATEWVVSIPLGCLAVSRAPGGAAGWAAAARALLQEHGAALAARLDALRRPPAAGVGGVGGGPGGPGGPGSPGGPGGAGGGPEGGGGGGVTLRPWRLVMTGGTVTTAAAAELALPRYEHARVHMAETSAAALMRLASEMESPEAQASAVSRLPWLTPVRAASLGPGCAALSEVALWLDARRCPGGGARAGDDITGGDVMITVSDRDLLDGLALQLLRGGG